MTTLNLAAKLKSKNYGQILTESMSISRNNIIPFILVTLLFGLWGFANAVTDPMVQAFKKVLELSNSQAAWVQMAFYGGYFCMALPASIFMKKYSYKVGILIGLGLYATGALLFYPAAINEQFWFFCLSLYVLTFGLAFLETAANPYVLALGSQKTATRRLNLAQSFNPLGLLAGLLVAQQFVLRNLKSDDIADFRVLDEVSKVMIRTTDLMTIRNPYVILGLVIIGVFVLFLVNKMPQSRDNNESSSENTSQSIKALVRNKKYITGVLAQTLYIGAQIMSWTYIYHYAEAINIDNLTAGYYQFAAFVLFTVGRLVGTFLLKYISGAKLLALFSLLAASCIAGAVCINSGVGLYCIVLTSFFMSIMYPTIFATSLGGLSEEEAKIGSAGLVMGIVGGALMPKLQGMIIDIAGTGVADIRIMGLPEVNLSFILPLISFAYITWYALYGCKDKSATKLQF
ncbi:L-fucose:H+ symporter permease [Mangrovibacterium marinum]|uniref:FHS family L-fucose permease-like MFS transporter n=1 Tax=Mangrovibacterium marinum TaxID=1639118 RepID=A0A2T5C559_9BACT|nr:L-fucose:H+ symporter permease [Mangrovibacterium marinum]PTN10033.1 FHS family L-fucose permease-like MFS transporter [Mangrovibacterium marinum]